MTTEEAIEELENGEWWDLVGDISCDDDAMKRLHGALDMAIAALRTQRTPLDRSRREECRFCNAKTYIKTKRYFRSCLAPATYVGELTNKLEDLTGEAYVESPARYCSACGRPLTETAWAELERRIGGNNETD